MVREALKNATGELLPEIDELFEGVYEKMPNSLLEQREELRNHVKKYPNDYELEKFKNGKSFLNWGRSHIICKSFSIHEFSGLK